MFNYRSQWATFSTQTIIKKIKSRESWGHSIRENGFQFNQYSVKLRWFTIHSRANKVWIIMHPTPTPKGTK